MAEETQTVTKVTRKKFCSKVYINKDGSESRHASPDVDRLEFRFENGNVVTVKLTEIGKGVARAAAWHGVAQKIGDSYNKATTADEAQEATETMLERLTNDEWVKPGEGAGPKTGVLVEAIANALTKQGETVDDERKAKIKEMVSDKAGREGAMANPIILAEYKSLQAAAAVERAAKAATAADASDATLANF